MRINETHFKTIIQTQVFISQAKKKLEQFHESSNMAHQDAVYLTEMK